MPLDMTKDYLVIIEVDGSVRIGKFTGYEYFEIKGAARRLRVWNQLYGEHCNFYNAKDKFLYPEERHALEKYLPDDEVKTISSIRIVEINSDRDFLKNQT